MHKLAKVIGSIICLCPMMVMAEMSDFNYGNQNLFIDITVPNFVKEKQTFSVPVSIDSERPENDIKSEHLKIKISDISSCSKPITVEPSTINLEIDGEPKTVKFSTPASPCNHTINFAIESKSAKPQTIYRVDISVNNQFGSEQVNLVEKQSNEGLTGTPPANWSPDQ